MRYNARHHYDWSPAIAYSVGLIASDGCLQRDGRHIDLTSKDIAQLEAFCHAIDKTIRVSTKKNGRGQVSYRVQFSDVAYYDFLLHCGLTPAKSKTLGALKIPDAYFGDFLRGVFDGDGTCYGYIDRRWSRSHMFYIGFASASPTFIAYLRITNKRLFDTGAGSIKRSGNLEILSYAKADSRKLYAAMYTDLDAPRLERKYTKLRGFNLFRFHDTISKV